MSSQIIQVDTEHDWRSPFRAIAVDFDGTISEAGRRPTPEVLEAIGAWRRSGRKALLVTGRILSELHQVFPDVHDHFDCVVGEDGSLFSAAGSTRLLVPPVEYDLDRPLQRSGVSFRRGQVIIATQSRYDAVVNQVIRELGLECHIVRNRTEMMILPAGVCKGFGVRQALDELKLSYHNTVAIGDAENDHSLLSMCEVGVAVENSVDSLKRHADLVASQPNGRGVVEVFQGPLVRGETRLVPRRWQISLGQYADGSRATLPGARVNVLVTGRSTSGKSYMAGLLFERVVELGYSACLIDVEGNYDTLRHLQGVTVLRAGGRGLLDGQWLKPMIEHRFGSVIVDLSAIEPARIESTVLEVVDQLRDERRRLGLPHWILVDEAQRSLGGIRKAEQLLSPGERGFCLVSWRPELIEKEVWELLDAVVVTAGGKRSGPPESDPLLVVERQLDIDLRHLVDEGRQGQALLLRWEGESRPELFEIAQRRVPHVRHRRKYRRGEIPFELRFHFRDPRGDGAGIASNVAEFHELIVTSPPEVIRAHASRADFSRWIRDVIQDERLGDHVEQLERNLVKAEDEDAFESNREGLLNALRDRYLV